MASSLSRRLTTALLQNPISALRQSISNLKASPQPKPNNPILLNTFTLIPLSSSSSSSSTTTTLFHCGVPTHPNPNPSESPKIHSPPTPGLPKPISEAPGTSNLFLFRPKSTTTTTTTTHAAFQAAKPIYAALLEKPTRTQIPRFRKTHLGFPPPKLFSTSPDQNQPQGGGEGAGAGDGGGGQEFRHQEIVGPTVERDVSALANETRQVLGTMRKKIYELSVSIALLGVTHLCLGAWIIYSAKPPTEVSVQGIAASSFLLAVALLMRQSLKPMVFFNKMEEQGRLQILTLTLQVSKNLNSMLSRMRVVSLFSVFATSLATALCFR